MSQMIGDELLEQLQPQLQRRVKRREKVLPGQSFCGTPTSGLTALGIKGEEKSIMTLKMSEAFLNSAPR